LDASAEVTKRQADNEDWEGASDDGLEDSMLVPHAKATKSPLYSLRSGHITKSRKSSSAKSVVHSCVLWSVYRDCEDLFDNLGLDYGRVEDVDDDDGW
jgi:hypothetical protein